MASDPGPVGAGLARSRGLLWLVGFALLGWGLAGLVELRPAPPRLLLDSRASDAKIECYGREAIELALVSRLDTAFDTGRMVLTVPVLDSEGDPAGRGQVRIVVPRSARTVLVDEEGAVTVLARPLPPPLLQALLEAAAGSTLSEQIEGNTAALTALRSLPEVREFLMSP